jgi:hypothetical protein
VNTTRGDDGVWTLHREPDEEANPFYDEALPRYLTAFDRAFTRAADTCESEFVKALVRVGGAQDAGWEPYETTLDAVPSIMKLHEEIPDDTGWDDFYTARHLQLWVYGHIIEASEPYAILSDMLHIAAGGWFMPYRFPEKKLGGKKAAADPLAPTRPQFLSEKFPQIEELAEAAGLDDALEPIREVWDSNLRNAIFHADYGLYGGAVRTKRKGSYTHEQIQTLVNRALAYHEVMAYLVRAYRRGYEEPVELDVHPDAASEPGEKVTVVVRDGDGALGIRYVHTREEVAAGAIPAYLARLFPDEVQAMRDDPTLVRLPARPAVNEPSIEGERPEQPE